MTTAFLDDHGDALLTAAATPATPLILAVAGMAKVLSSDPIVSAKGDPFKGLAGKEWRTFGDSVRTETLIDTAVEDHATTTKSSEPVNYEHTVQVARKRDGTCSVTVNGDDGNKFSLRGTLEGNTLKVAVEQGDGIPRSFEVKYILIYLKR